MLNNLFHFLSIWIVVPVFVLLIIILVTKDSYIKKSLTIIQVLLFIIHILAFVGYQVGRG